MSMPPAEAPDSITCAGCGSETSKSLVATGNYSCPRCSLELAHLDTAPNGAVRGVIGWLRVPGDVVNERYRVSKLLGRGGFAVTYLVEDMLLSGKRRALKEVPEILSSSGISASYWTFIAATSSGVTSSICIGDSIPTSGTP